MTDGTNDDSVQDTPLRQIDPTANVLSLVKAAIQRQDDLRLAESKLNAEIRRIEERCAAEIGTLKEKLADAGVASLRLSNLAESRRVDAVLADQKNNVALANTRAELTASALAERVDTSAKALATSVTASAEALRLQVQATTDSITTQIGILRTDTGTRITSLEQNRYAAGGASMQRTEGRQISQWAIGIMIVIAVGLMQLLLRLLGK
jgi:hypothetical protein